MREAFNAVPSSDPSFRLSTTRMTGMNPQPATATVAEKRDRLLTLKSFKSSHSIYYVPGVRERLKSRQYARVSCVHPHRLQSAASRYRVLCFRATPGPCDER